MSNAEDSNSKKSFSDYVFVLWKWKIFLSVNLVIAILFSLLIAFSIPITYKATAVIFIPPDNSIGFGSVTSLLNSKSSASLGSKLFGVANTSEDMLVGILNSKTTLMHVIAKFNLFSYYEIEDRNIDKTLKLFLSDLSFGPNDHGMIEVSVINRDPHVAADMANYFVAILDSINIKFNTEQARNNRIYIEQRYMKNISELKAYEDSMFVFQKKYGIFTLPDQFKTAIQGAAEVESTLFEKEMIAHRLSSQFGENSIQYKQVEDEITILRNKVKELKSANKLSNESNVLFPFKEGANIFLQYFRYYRAIEIQNKIMEVVLPVYEQAKLDEAKSIPTIMTLDAATPPQLKYAPKRSLVILLVTSIALLISMIFVFWGERYSGAATTRNPVEKFYCRFTSRLKRVYRINN